MAGSGKTSLILKLLNSPAVRSQFYPIIWLCLSDINSKEDAEYEVNIVKFILCEMGCDVDKWTVINPSMPHLLKHLRKLLMRNKYVIVFDDVWENNEFYANLGDALPLPLPGSDIAVKNGLSLSEALPRDSGGKIIITSRQKEVGKSIVGDKNLIPMKPLSRESCRMILEDDIFTKYAKKVEELGCDEGVTKNKSGLKLREIVSQSLRCKKYLIVLTDVVYNNSNFWRLISSAWPKDGDGTILVSSKRKELTEYLVDENIVHVRLPKSRSDEGSEVAIDDRCCGLPYSAKMIFEYEIVHPSVGEKFEPIIWVPLPLICLNYVWSDFWNVRAAIAEHVLQELGYGDNDELIKNKMAYDLWAIAYELLGSKKYLIVLDDVVHKNSDFWGLVSTMWPKDDGGTLIQISKEKELIGFVDHLVHVRLPEWECNEGIIEVVRTDGD
ncbi:putative P-loop containing nucleoside triphosphate hydrolase [Senna tora]|uniref:Putative P-loop containing nucleoside triphosphate hydrolase n=1 Tax=Senna tora TaxID=362788 RepID=A0A834XJA9_9FABA|nr:putative P-loop containing nucleoside triphosphate hydrolase [Senna tora]